MKKGCLYPIVGLLSQMAALLAAVVGGSVYTQQIQVKECYAYARIHALPNRDSLEFSGVVVATNQFHGHTCQFKDKRTGFPVSLEFDAADVPYGSDTLSVMSMVVPALVVGIFTAVVLSRLVSI